MTRRYALPKSAVQKTKLGQEELEVLGRLHKRAGLVDQCASLRPVEELIVEERRLSRSYRGPSCLWMGATGTNPK